jgi:hypothetical protein
VQGLKSNQGLKTLRIRYSSFSDSVLSQLVEAAVQDNPSLQELDLCGNYCRDASLHAIASCLEQFSILTLGDPDLDDDDDDDDQENQGEFHVSIIIDAFKKDIIPLREFTLRRCHFVDCQVEDLLSVLLKCPYLEKVDISFNRISKLNFEGLDVSALADDLKTTSSLRELNLSWNRLCQVGPLFRVLSQCQHLERLDLSHNDLSELQFLDPFFCQPSYPRCLRHLHIFSNPFERSLKDGDTELEDCLLAILQSNPNLGDLAFWDYGNVHDQILHFMDRNWAGIILFGNHQVPPSLWPKVMERVNDYHNLTPARKADALFGLLQGSGQPYSSPTCPREKEKALGGLQQEETAAPIE